MEPEERIHSQNCFGCGFRNPIGLKITFTVGGDGVVGEFISNENHEGFPGLVHGGVLAAILDEALSYITRISVPYGILTLRETITFRNISHIGERLKVEAKITEEKTRAFVAIAKVFNQKGVIAEAEGTLLKVKV